MLSTDYDIHDFLLRYPGDVKDIALRLRLQTLKSLPGVHEQLDIPARMIAYSYGSRYSDMICCIFPSQKGVKLSFYKGVDLKDPKGVLKGAAKTTRYYEVGHVEELQSIALKNLLAQALAMYRARVAHKDS